MPSLRAVLAAPFVVAYWLATNSKALGSDLIFLYHGTPRHRARELERQLRYLCRAFRIVPLASIAASVADRQPLGREPHAAITFDDGLRSNVTVAYPILRRLGIPATFFVCPGLIEERKWLWTHEARRRFQFAGAPLREELAAELHAPAEIELFVEWMKKLDLPKRAHAEGRLREATARFVPSASDHEAFDLAGWRELRSLDPRFVTIGSHSMTHPILPKLTESTIEVELRDSRRMIEAKLERPAKFFSYPNDDFDARVLARVRRHYEAATLCTQGAAMPLDPHLLPSLSASPGVLRLTWQLNRWRFDELRLAARQRLLRALKFARHAYS